MNGSRHLLRLHRDEEGYALVIAVLLVAIMMVLMVVALNAGQASLHQSQEDIRWTRTLAIAEAGINQAITTLGQDRTATSSCPIGSATACPAEGGQYQVSWQRQADGSIVVDARGYYPSLSSARHTRQVRVVLEPVPVFRYALFSQDALTVKNNAVIVGDVYSALGVTVDNNQIICGSVIAAGGDRDPRQQRAGGEVRGDDGVLRQVRARLGEGLGPRQQRGGDPRGREGLRPLGRELQPHPDELPDLGRSGAGQRDRLRPDHRNRGWLRAAGGEHDPACRGEPADLRVRHQQLPQPHLLPEHGHLRTLEHLRDGGVELQRLRRRTSVQHAGHVRGLADEPVAEHQGGPRRDQAGG
ncbi:MAG: hypothetical protein KatS3mg014_1265 [Actinomycetota bacterium]|nr:MAG: hypothetical protein KatS3mg014_1265 [Actinomycetota bacterium]